MYHGTVDLHIFYISIETKCSNRNKRYAMRVRREMMSIYRYQIESVRNEHLNSESTTSTEQEWYGRRTLFSTPFFIHTGITCDGFLSDAGHNGQGNITFLIVEQEVNGETEKTNAILVLIKTEFVMRSCTYTLQLIAIFPLKIKLIPSHN